MQDPIADMLTRIRNGYLSHLSEVTVPFSKIKLELAKLLSKQGVVGAVREDKDGRSFVVELSYANGEPKVSHIKRVSKPGIRIYRKAKELRPVRRGLGLVVVSTSQGLMTDADARKKSMGGEVLVEVW